jgi:general secretion pathway protein D
LCDERVAKLLYLRYALGNQLTLRRSMSQFRKITAQTSLADQATRQTSLADQATRQTSLGWMFCQGKTALGSILRMALLGSVLSQVLMPSLAFADASDGAPHTLNLKDVDVNVLIATVSEITGKTFIVDPAVQGKVNVVSNQPLSKDELYETFLSVLRVHGFAAIDAGSAIRIVPDQKAASDGAIGLGASGGNEMVTRIIELKHVSPAEMVQLLSPLKSPSAQLMAHNGSSSLLIADRGSNVNRMIEIVRRIDQAAQADIEIVPLSNANSAEIARTINGLSSGNDASPKLVADERTNSILIAGDRSRRLKLRALVASLDTPLAGSDTMEVIYLRYADAEQLVGILEGVLRGSRTAGGQSLPGASLGGVSPPGSTGGSIAANPGASTVIQAHKETNSLIVTAPPAVLRELKSLVRQLDIRRAQVLIEAVVAEVTEEKAKQLGIQWQGAGYDREGVVGGTNFPPGGDNSAPSIVGTQGALGSGAAGALGALAGAGGLNIGYIGRSITLPGSDTPIVQLGALASALASDGNGNVLSQPSTIALDHQKATLSVGQEVPFITGRYQTGVQQGGGLPGNGSGVNPFQTIDRKEVGLKLIVTPHINEGSAVRMDVELEVSSLAPNVAGASDLITNTRKLTTQAIVRDGGMLVLGGLTSNQLRESESRVPGLGRIPLLGNLFKSRSTRVERRNLMVFIKPSIARDGMSEDALTFGKYNSVRDDQLRAQEGKSSLTPEGSVPVLPDIRSYLQENQVPAEAPVSEPVRKPGNSQRSDNASGQATTQATAQGAVDDSIVQTAPVRTPAVREAVELLQLAPAPKLAQASDPLDVMQPLRVRPK